MDPITLQPIPKPPSCRSCIGWLWGSTGFVPADGLGTNRVLLVFEAAGETEAAVGRPLMGKAGQSFERMLQRGGMKRDEFRIHNVLSCRPPNNKLRGEDYEDAVISACAPNLDVTIRDCNPRAIVAGGDVALGRLLGKHGIEKHRGYVFWSDKYRVWIIPTYHPSHIMRGQTAKEAVFIHDIQRAVEIAKDGYAPHRANHLLDPTPVGFGEWIQQYEQALAASPATLLSVDIECPEKGDDEGELDTDDTISYSISRIGFCFRPGYAVSIPWRPEYVPLVRRILGSKGDKLFWNKSFDIPRIIAAGVLINGACHDGMIAWHILNSDLPKGLGYVATFCAPLQQMWKHLSSEEPAYYNAVDNDIALQNMIRTTEELRKHDLWRVYDRHVLRLDPVLSAMSRAGMPIDAARRLTYATKLHDLQVVVRARMQEIVPLSVRRLQPKDGYIRTPDSTDGLTEVLFDAQEVKRCERCGELNPKKPHFRILKTKVNPCGGASTVVTVEGVKRWTRVLPFVPSQKQLLAYLDFKRHTRVFTGRGDDRKATTDIKAINTLIGKYPDDPLYPLVKEDRELDKLSGTYIGRIDPIARGGVRGGMPVGADLRIHTEFGHTPSTLRLSSSSPNLQNIPRGNDPAHPLQQFVKQMFVASQGKTFLEVDFAGIEAVLVGWFIGSARYTRLAKLGVHDFFNAHVLADAKTIPTSDLPDLKWPDAQLKAYFKSLKARFPVERDVAKRVIHGSNYMMTPQKMHHEYPETFRTTKDARRLQGIYFDLFSEIPRWHETLCHQVDKDCYIRNPFGYVHRFYRVLNWERIGGKWQWSFGDDAKRLIAFLPQSTAAAIIKEALMRLYYDQPLVRALLRLVIHDSILSEVDLRWVDTIKHIIIREMSKPIPELPLDPAWGMGDYLTIGVDAKVGECWGSMS